MPAAQADTVADGGFAQDAFWQFTTLSAAMRVRVHRPPGAESGHEPCAVAIPGGRTGYRDRLREPGPLRVLLDQRLGYVRNGAAPGRYQSLLPADGTRAEILLQRVPEGKDRKNRVHLDLRTRDLEPELQRLLSLGATLLTDQPVSEAGWRWYVLAAPDGDEFCVLQPPDSYWPGPR